MERKLFSSLLQLLCVLIALSGPASVFGSTFQCIQLKIKTHLGKVATRSKVSGLELYDPTSRYLFLGEGEHGGTVYRVHPSNGKPPYVLKEYFDSGQRTWDALAFSKLHKLMPHTDGIEIVHPELLGKRSMKLPNIEGETLEKAIEDPNLSHSERVELTRRWNQFVKSVYAAMRADPHSIRPLHRTRNSLYSCYSPYQENGQRFMILHKPDNVIVEAKTGRMFVVDPY
ncbi:MAG: hypothetical protein ACJ763_04375 [Bdellovibrionia bacterium]